METMGTQKFVHYNNEVSIIEGYPLSRVPLYYA